MLSKIIDKLKILAEANPKKSNEPQIYYDESTLLKWSPKERNCKK